MSVIVKVQLPLYSNEDAPHMLIYSEDRDIEIYAPMQERFIKDLKKFPHKGYYEAVVTDDVVDIGRRVRNQRW